MAEVVQTKSAGEFYAYYICDLRLLLIAKKEAKRLEKETRLAAKTAKAAVTSEKKPKLEKEKKIEDAPFVNLTPKGEKKGRVLRCLHLRI
jgi:hypothetical protein